MVGQAGGVGVCVSSGGIPPLSLTQAARLPEPTWHVSGMGAHEAGLRAPQSLRLRPRLLASPQGPAPGA